MIAGGALRAVRHGGEEAMDVDLPDPVGHQADDVLQPLLRRQQAQRNVGFVRDDLHEAGERRLLSRAIGQRGIACPDGDGAAVGVARAPSRSTTSRCRALREIRVQQALRLRRVHQQGGQGVVAVIGPDHGAVEFLEEHRRLGGDRSVGQQDARERLREIVSFACRRIERVGPWRRRRGHWAGLMMAFSAAAGARAGNRDFACSARRPCGRFRAAGGRTAPARAAIAADRRSRRADGCAAAAGTGW